MLEKKTKYEKLLLYSLSSAYMCCVFTAPYSLLTNSNVEMLMK